MGDDRALLAPPAGSGLRERILTACALAAMRATLVVSPRPAALMLRRRFASGGAATAATLDRHAPVDVTVLRDARYGAEPDMLLDLYRPVSATQALPLVMWVHGGGWLGGSKEELAGWFRILAGFGYAVAGPRYALAPEHRYPTPVRQLMQALAHLDDNASALGIDMSRVALGGDSAGAQLAAQLAALVTTPGYPETVGITPTIAAARLRGLVLACGPYDAGLARDPGSELGRRFLRIVLWAYSGTRHYLDDPAFATVSVTNHLSAAFPPTLVTVGNADPLREHSELLAARLADVGCPPETLLFDEADAAKLDHEYQFDLDTPEAQLFLARTKAFLERYLAG
jgi:acetyl esterase/lipase